jgi:hypothetical protein
MVKDQHGSSPVKRCYFSRLKINHMLTAMLGIILELGTDAARYKVKCGGSRVHNSSSPLPPPPQIQDFIILPLADRTMD